MILWNSVELKMEKKYKQPQYFSRNIRIALVVYLILSLGNHVGSPMHSVVSLFQSQNDVTEIDFLPQYNNFFSKILTVEIGLQHSQILYPIFLRYTLFWAKQQCIIETFLLLWLLLF